MRRDNSDLMVFAFIGFMACYLLFTVNILPGIPGQNKDLVPSGFVDLNEIQKEYTVLNSTIQARNAQITDLQTHVTKLEAANEGLIEAKIQEPNPFWYCIWYVLGVMNYPFYKWLSDGFWKWFDERRKKKQEEVKIEN
jgi:hypothetical protein